MLQDEQVESFMEIPHHLSHRPLIIDKLSSSTSTLQASTIEECLPLLSLVSDPSADPFDFDEEGYPLLQRSQHIDFIHNGLQPLPAAFVAMDASRPWLMYWSLLSLHILGEDTTSFCNSIVTTFTSLQNKTGGFGGGQGHLSHLAPTYAVILSVAMVGSKRAYELVDRVSLWSWLGRLKQVDGSFLVCENGENDVRGAYCALVAITLLDLPWQLPHDSPARCAGLTDFRDGLGEHLSLCQTFEGGVSANPSNEAHGAYTFCALACLCLLGEPQESICRYLSLDSLIKWLSERQYAPEGGFAGRTNKVVDGCYSHWIGGCWPLVEAALRGPVTNQGSVTALQSRIFSDDSLARYVLSCCQAMNGGLRDKPSKRPDTYHTCYNLAGLSMVQHYHQHDYEHKLDNGKASLRWTTKRTGLSPYAEEHETEQDEISANLRAFDPVYVAPNEAVGKLRSWSCDAPGDFPGLTKEIESAT